MVPPAVWLSSSTHKKNNFKKRKMTFDKLVFTLIILKFYLNVGRKSPIIAIVNGAKCLPHICLKKSLTDQC